MTDTTPQPRQRLPKWLKRGALAAALVAALAVGILAYLGVWGDNFRVVAAGQAYCSGQMSAEDLKRTLDSRQIKCVVNLLGEHDGAGWYGQERAVCRAAGVIYEDIALGLGKIPPPDAVKALAARLQAGPFPMYWHCRRGVDRSGLAAVLYLMIVEKRGLDDALRSQLTWRNGHFSVGAARSIDRFFELYRRTGGGRDIRDWITQDYPALYLKEK